MRALCAWVPFLIGLGATPSILEATPPPVAPVIEFQAIPDRESVEHGEHVDVFLIVTNKSSVAIRDLKVSMLNDAFTIVCAPSYGPCAPPFASSLGPLGSFQQTITIVPKDTAAFVQHKVFLRLDYAWSQDGRDVRSTQATSASLQVKRHFEDEAKGFPGGTAAVLYLLLPVVPAFLSYTAVEKLRRGEGLQVPTFRNEHIVFAFLLAIIISFVTVVVAHHDLAIAYSNPGVFVGVLFASAMVGAVFPGARLLRALLINLRWGFTHQDTLASYLKKALLGPQSPHDFVWVQGTVKGETWQGVRLRQPNGLNVLGARLQISPKPEGEKPPSEASWKKLTAEGVDDQGVLKDRHRLIQLLETGAVSVGFLEKIGRGNERLDAAVVADGLGEFEQKEVVSKPLVVAVR